MEVVMKSFALAMFVIALALGKICYGELMPVKEPLRLRNEEPFVGIYYFHWWEPWASNDEASLEDLKKMRDAGFNVLFIDHEASQAIPNDFAILDREHRLAKETGLEIVPWLGLTVFGDMATEGRIQWAKERYGAGPSADDYGFRPYGSGTIEFATRYTLDYIDRYKDQALCHVIKDGTACPVVALSAETGWHWHTAANDPEARMQFSRWLRNKYKTIEALNKAYDTEYDDFFRVDPRDEAVFDYVKSTDVGRRAISTPVKDHVLFRAEFISDMLSAVRAGVREKYPNALIGTEIPYAIADEHPHAWGYQISMASIANIAEHADILFSRGGGVSGLATRRALLDYARSTGKDVVINHRISPHQGPGYSELNRETLGALFAHEAAAYCSGLGFYSWNEMVDVHMASNKGTCQDHPDAISPVTPEEHERLYEIVYEINHLYQGIYKRNLKEVNVPPVPFPGEELNTVYWLLREPQRQ